LRTVLPAEFACRQQHEHTPEVSDLGGSDRAPGVASGSVWVVCGHPRSALVALARAGTGAGAVALADAATSTVARFDRDEPIVQVSYNGTAIAAGAFRDHGLCALLPFAGGALDPRKFAGASFVAPDADAPAVSTLVIVCEPRLSDLEQRALDRLPAEDRLAVGGEADAGASVPRLLEMRAELMLAGRLS